MCVFRSRTVKTADQILEIKGWEQKGLNRKKGRRNSRKGKTKEVLGHESLKVAYKGSSSWKYNSMNIHFIMLGEHDRLGKKMIQTRTLM